MFKVGVIIGSTRPGRTSPAVAEWVTADRSQPDLQMELVDLAEIDLPMLREPIPPAWSQYHHQHTRDWAETISGFDAFVLVTPEYNHSTSAVLKNALDHLYAEWRDKPVAFVGYGIEGGVRAVEHLRGITAELGMVGVSTQVSLRGDPATSPDAEHYTSARSVMLAELARWAAPCRQLRSPRNQDQDADPLAREKIQARPVLEPKRADPATREVVHRFVGGLQSALEAGDADAYDRDFAADIVWGSPYGLVLSGFEDVNQAHRSLTRVDRDNPPAAGSSRYEVVQVKVPAPGVALAHVRRQALTQDGSADHEGFSEMALYVLIERDGHWWLAAGQNTPVAASRP